MTPAKTGRFKKSRYLLVSDRRYRTEQGQIVRLAYSSRTGTIVPMDDATVSLLETGDVGAVPAPMLDHLRGSEAIVPLEEDELTSVVGRIRASSDGAALRRITIMPTSYCNMACSYCGQEHRKDPVREGRMRQVTDRVTGIMAVPETQAVHVTWFGGEPLLGLRVIREMSGEFIDAAARHGKRYSATLVTNGSLLTVRNASMLAQDCRVEWLEVTLDGTAPTHDKRRLKKNGTGSYHHITRVLSDLLRTEACGSVRLGIRVNADSENADEVAALIADLIARGIRGSRVWLHPAKVHSWGNDVSAVELEARSYADREAEWLRLASSVGLQTSLLPTRAARTTCIATTSSGELIDPSGNLYSCSEHPLVPGVGAKGIVATLDTLAVTARRPAGQFDNWYDQVSEGARQCSSCAFFPVCGGSCPKSWHEGNVPCPSYKFNWQARLDLSASQLGLSASD